MIFSSINKPLKGSGSTKELAITNAISKIAITMLTLNFHRNREIENCSYYETKCVDIIKNLTIHKMAVQQALVY
jgi:hypothetical protein